MIDDPYYIEMYDFEHSVDKDKYIVMGKIGDILFVVFTERKETIRLFQLDLQQMQNGNLIMTKTLIIERGQKPTEE